MPTSLSETVEHPFHQPNPATKKQSSDKEHSPTPQVKQQLKEKMLKQSSEKEPTPQAQQCFGEQKASPPCEEEQAEGILILMCSYFWLVF